MAGRKPKTIAQHAATHGVSEKTIENRMRGDVSDSVEEKRQAEIRKITLDADKSELAIKIVEGDLYPRATVDEMIRKIGFVTNALLRATSSELPPLVAGLTPAKAEKVIKDWSIAWTDRLKDAKDDVWIEARKAVVASQRGDLKKVAAAKLKKGE